jgi:hypothetical protein
MKRLLVAALVCLAGCGDSPSSGTCLVIAVSKCFEVTGDAASVSAQQMSCGEADGTWSSDPCPTQSLIGCCAFTLGALQFRECFYTGTPSADPQGDCATMRSGVWTPAP